MGKFFSIIFLSLVLAVSVEAKSQENELICSKRYHFCFQIPPNFFMLNTNDIESSSLSYKTVDGSSSIEIYNGTIAAYKDFHSLYLVKLAQWSARKSRVTLKKEYSDFFIISGYTSQGRGFYQKVLKIDGDYASLYLEFPKGNNRYSNISRMIFDYFERTVLD